MSLDVLRCKTPEMVRTELWMGLLARQPRAAFAAVSRRDRGLLAATIELLRRAAILGNHLADCGHRDDRPGTPDRPAADSHGRAQSRNSSQSHRTARKRRPSSHDLLTKPRAAARAELLAVCLSQLPKPSAAVPFRSEPLESGSRFGARNALLSPVLDRELNGSASGHDA